MPAHEQSVGRSDEWYTPPFVFDALGERFDLDVAHPGLDARTRDGALVDWIPADGILTGGSLDADWWGFVWMNPPFGKRMGVVPWLEKFFAHGNGIALTPDRTPCPWWQSYAHRADAVLFWRPKISFVPGPGVKSSSNGMGTCLFAAGDRAVMALQLAASRGRGRLFAPLALHATTPDQSAQRELSDAAPERPCVVPGETPTPTIPEGEER